jgi:hypothetical protein
VFFHSFTCRGVPVRAWRSGGGVGGAPQKNQKTQQRQHKKADNFDRHCQKNFVQASKAKNQKKVTSSFPALATST